ncbi:MAG: M56 family metallopeptidase, partial [Bacteroidota bacterium]
MSFIAQYFQEEFIYAMGWTVLHSFWQGIAIALIMAVVLASLQGRSARLRYEIASFSLFLMLVSAVCTFIYLYDHSSSTMTAAALDATTVHIVAPAGGESGGLLNGFFQTCNTYFNDHLPLIVSVWLLGMAFFLLRLLGGLAYVQGLRNRHNRPMEEFWQHKMKGLASRMRIRRPVALLESAQVKVPMVIGYLKPAILMPLGAINQLNMNEVEAILAHELAHIRRNDYLLNILIAMIEALFYYNPAVWWMAANIRSERENCCDDLAIQVCGNSLTYAKALVRIQELHQASIPAFAMSFSGNKKQLLHRIRRILNQPQNRSHIREKLGATCLLLMMILFVSMGAGPSQQEDNQQSSEWIEVESFEPTTVFFESSTEQTDSLPPQKKKSKTKAHYFKETDGRKVELKIE